MYVCVCTFVSILICGREREREEIVKQKSRSLSGLLFIHDHYKQVDLVGKKGVYFCPNSKKGHTDTSILFIVLTFH